MNETSPKLPPPELGSDPLSIHLWYVRRDVGEIKSTLSDMKNGFVTRVDFDEHLKSDTDHENRIRTIEQSTWKNLGFSSAIGAVISLIGASLIQHYIH